jgi:NHL repeat
MIKQNFYGFSMVAVTAVVLLLSGCKSTTVSKVQEPAASSKRAHAKTPSLAAPSASVSLPVRVAIGTQQGGARQSGVLSLKNTVSTFAGRAGQAGADDGNANRASFDSPKGITTDGVSLYLADLNNHTIRKIDIESGYVSTLAGMAGKKGSNDGKGAAARFNRPYGITTDGTNLYVTDSNNHTIRQVDIESGVVTTIAGVTGEVGYRNGSAKQARFFIPEGITSDGSNLYVSDTHNHSIRKIDMGNNVVSTIAGQSGAPGYIDDTKQRARFSYPKGITTDGRNLYVVDFGNHRVRKIGLASGIVSTLSDGGDNSEGSSAEQEETVRFNYPTGVTTDGRYLFVVDTFNRTVRKLHISGGTAHTIAGKADLEGADDGAGVDARFKDPVGITSDGSYLFVTDSANHTVRKIR